MKLLRATIDNYRAIEHLELGLTDAFGSPRPVTVLAGPNGSGKTSILFAITNALRGVLGYRAHEVPIPSRDDIRVSSKAIRAWTTQLPEIRVSLDLKLDDEELQVIPELYRVLDREGPPALPEGAVTVKWSFPPRLRDDGTRQHWSRASLEPSLPRVHLWLRARGTSIRAWVERTPGMRREFLDSIGGLSFFPQDRNLQERVLGATEAPTGRAATIEDMDQGSDADESDTSVAAPTRQPLSVTEILRYLSDYARGHTDVLPEDRNWERRIQDAFHEICAPKRYLGYLYREDDPLGAPVLEDNGYQYPLSQAASGEQVILEYITRLTYPQPAVHSLVLIDEPEIHLHPAWARLLYLTLPRLPGSNQYLLSTHSDELRKRAAADNALVDLGQLDEVISS